MNIRTPDYLYYTSPNGEIIEDKYNKKKYFDVKSITKMFLLFALLSIKQIRLTDRVSKYYPKYPYKNIKIIDIVNHTSGLQNDWMENGKPTQLQKSYWASKDIYAFALKLKQLPGQYGKFMYNNYTYNILASIIKKVTHKDWDKQLSVLFPKARFKIHKYHGLPFASHSLFIRKTDIRYISTTIMENKYHDLIRLNKLIPHTQKYYRKLLPGVKFSGHDGSGGQDLTFNNKEVYWVLSYDNPDTHKRGLTSEESKAHLIRVR